MTEDGKALAVAAKERGNTEFAKKTREGYEKALEQYKEAIGHDPENHVLHANSAAAYIELGGVEWDPKKKLEAYAQALSAAKQCTKLGPDWAKGYVRLSTAEFEVIAAAAKWEDRKKQDEKWQKEDEERAKKDPKDSFVPEPKEPKVLGEDVKTIVDEASYSSCEAACRRGLELEPGNELLRTRLQALRDDGHATDEEKDRAMRLPEAAAPLKVEGNKAFTAKKWTEAAEHFTKALAQDPFDHVFYSNRSACYAEAEEFPKALRDAEKCIATNPKFAKGYSRHALALYHEGRYPEMESAAKAGLEVDPDNKTLQDSLKQAQAETCESADTQRHLHKLRQEKRQDLKLQNLMSTLNMGGQNVQMFNPGAGGFGGGDLSSLLGGLGGGGGGGGFGGSGKSRMTEEQMRGMARAMATAPAASSPAAAAAPAAASKASSEPAAPASGGPSSFAPA